MRHIKRTTEGSKIASLLSSHRPPPLLSCTAGSFRIDKVPCVLESKAARQTHFRDRIAKTQLHESGTEILEIVQQQPATRSSAAKCVGLCAPRQSTALI